jgi:hypothetical protein
LAQEAASVRALQAYYLCGTAVHAQHIVLLEDDIGEG